MRTKKVHAKNGWRPPRCTAGDGRSNNIVYNRIVTYCRLSVSALSGHSDSQESSARLINFHHEPTNDIEPIIVELDQNVQIIVTEPPAMEPAPGTSSETTQSKYRLRAVIQGYW
ncbi:hypothetical protein JYU34_021588 [Plutella xylostella]|uniref:Uncharacterized protein n=1 Tax=Plutella xylostella TaxID=51655 RepID=A0ABQ7PVH0_PLUXY|nr:hypothetical protein JYU34_021588 [Plutella xylostella]